MQWNIFSCTTVKFNIFLRNQLNSNRNIFSILKKLNCYIFYSQTIGFLLFLLFSTWSNNILRKYNSVNKNERGTVWVFLFSRCHNLEGVSQTEKNQGFWPGELWIIFSLYIRELVTNVCRLWSWSTVKHKDSYELTDSALGYKQALALLFLYLTLWLFMPENLETLWAVISKI